MSQNKNDLVYEKLSKLEIDVSKKSFKQFLGSIDCTRIDGPNYRLEFNSDTRFSNSVSKVSHTVNEKDSMTFIELVLLFESLKG